MFLGNPYDTFVDIKHIFYSGVNIRFILFHRDISIVGDYEQQFILSYYSIKWILLDYQSLWFTAKICSSWFKVVKFLFFLFCKFNICFFSYANDMDYLHHLIKYFWFESKSLVCLISSSLVMFMNMLMSSNQCQLADIFAAFNWFIDFNLNVKTTTIAIKILLASTFTGTMF